METSSSICQSNGMVNGDCGTAEIGQATHDRLALISKFSHFSATRKTWWFIPMMRTIISPISAARWISTESLSHPTDEVRELKIHFPTHDENEQKNWFRKRLTRAGDKFHVSLRAFAVARKRRRFKIADHKLEHNCGRGATRNELMGWKRWNRNSKSQPRGKLAASPRFPSRRGIWLSGSLRVIKGPIYMRAIKLCGLQSANTKIIIIIIASNLRWWAGLWCRAFSHHYANSSTFHGAACAPQKRMRYFQK